MNVCLIHAVWTYLVRRRTCVKNLIAVWDLIPIVSLCRALRFEEPSVASSHVDRLLCLVLKTLNSELDCDRPAGNNLSSPRAIADTICSCDATDLRMSSVEDPTLNRRCRFSY